MRMKFDPVAAQEAGGIDALKIIAAAHNLQFETYREQLIAGGLSGIIELAHDHRIEEAQTRADAFCRVIAQTIHRMVANMKHRLETEGEAA